MAYFSILNSTTNFLKHLFLVRSSCPPVLFPSLARFYSPFLSCNTQGSANRLLGGFISKDRAGLERLCEACNAHELQLPAGSASTPPRMPLVLGREYVCLWHAQDCSFNGARTGKEGQRCTERARKTRSSTSCLLILVVGEASGSQSRCERVKKKWAGEELVKIYPPIFTCSQAGGRGREL